MPTKKQKPKLTVPDKRMLQVIELLKQRGTIRFRQEFCEAIDFPKQNYWNVKEGIQSFRPVQIMATCKVYGIDANYIMGLTDEPFVHKAKIHFISEGVRDNKKVNTAAKTARKRS